MIKQAFIRINEIRAEQGLEPLSPDQVRVGTGPWSELSSMHVQNAYNADVLEKEEFLPPHRGKIADNEIAWKVTSKGYYELNVDEVINGWAESEGHRNILFQPTATKPGESTIGDSGPMMPNSYLVLNFSEFMPTDGTWDGAVDIRGAWIVEGADDAILANTVAAADVDTSLRDYVAPKKSDTMAKPEWDYYSGTIFDYNEKAFEKYYEGGKYVAPKPPAVNEGAPETSADPLKGGSAANPVNAEAAPEEESAPVAEEEAPAVETAPDEAAPVEETEAAVEAAEAEAPAAEEAEVFSYAASADDPASFLGEDGATSAVVDVTEAGNDLEAPAVEDAVE